MLEMHYYALYYYEHALVYKLLLPGAGLMVGQVTGECGRA